MSFRPPGNRRSATLADSFSGLQADYGAAKQTQYRRRRTGLVISGSGADYHYRTDADYLRIMEYARDMDRNDVIVGQTVNRAVGNTIGEGFKLEPQTGDKVLDAELWDRWDAWAIDADQCDVSGEMPFAKMESMALRAMLVDGDMVGLPSRDGGLQLVEAHRVRTPGNTRQNVIHGVLLDDRRRRLQYWMTKDDINPMTPVLRVGDMTVYPVRDEWGNRQIFHIYNPKRVSQTRGVSGFVPIFDSLGMFEDINFARLVQQQVVSCFAIFRQKTKDSKAGYGSQHGETTTEVRKDGSRKLIQGIAPGMELDGDVGEELKGFSPDVPNPSFFEHVRLILTLVGINLGMPLVMVLLDASETNFSGWRAAVDQARQGFRDNQQTMIHRLHRPAYRWKVRQWIAQDRAIRAAAERLGDAIFRHRWNPPAWSYIDPYKDAAADLLRLRNGLISPTRLHNERGREWDEVAAEIVRDNALAIRMAKKEAAKINSEFSDDQPVHWREVLALPTPEGMSVSFSAAEGASPPPKTGDKQNG